MQILAHFFFHFLRISKIICIFATGIINLRITMKKPTLFLALMLSLFSVKTLLATEPTHMKIEFLSGSEQLQAIAQIGKITFADSMMVLHDLEGNVLGSTDVRLIGKIVFCDSSPTTVTNATQPTIQVFPNPTQESLFVRGAVEKQTVRIYSMRGQLVQSAVITAGEAQLHVGGLPTGTYLLQIGAQVVRFIKE